LGDVQNCAAAILRRVPGYLVASSQRDMLVNTWVLLALVCCRDLAEGQQPVFEFPFAIEGDKVI
jgi:hypothetical protein